MEGVPNEMSESEKELSFEQQVALAKVLFDAVNNRNKFIEGFGGLDNFAEAWQHVGDNRKDYDELELASTNARKEFDEKIPDKKSFVETLKNSGEVEMAEMISMMFGVSERTQTPRKGVLSRIFGKK